MAIFPVLQIEQLVQVGEKVRLDCRASFVAPEEDITKLEVKPDTATDWLDVTASRFLDWVYSSDGDETASVRVTTATAEDVVTGDFTIISEESDSLFSSDSDLVAMEPAIRDLLPDGKSKFANVHREAQTKILDSLYKSGIRDVNGDRLTKAAIIDVKEVSEWSKNLTLQLIFEGAINAVDDVFAQKAAKYRAYANSYASAATILLDLDADGTADPASERSSLSSISVVRR